MSLHKILFVSAVILTLNAAAIFAQTMPPGADAKLWQKALAIHQGAVVVDGHNDITTPMFDDDFDLGTSSLGKFHADGDPFHTDNARLKQSGLTGFFFSIYVDRRYAEQTGLGSPAKRALELIDATYRNAERYPNQFTMATTTADILRAKKERKIAALMGIEGGHAIENSLSALRDFYRLGVRYMTLTHNNNNDWADSSRSAPAHNGLTDFGREVVREMNRLGMIVDVSHVSDKTMSDVLDVTAAPIIASHSSAFAISNHPRNISDDLLKRIAKNGGVVMVNFYPSFIDPEYRAAEIARDERLKTQIDALTAEYKTDAKGLNEAKRKLAAANPLKLPSYTRIVDHIDHIRRVAGIDSVGIGSDFDGVPSLPEGINGVEDLPVITYELLKRGYSETDIRKVLGENFMRAFAKVETVAKSNTRQISGAGSLKRIGKITN